MKCDCGGRFEVRLSDFDGLKSPAMVCGKCGEVTLTKVLGLVGTQTERFREVEHYYLPTNEVINP